MQQILKTLLVEDDISIRKMYHAKLTLEGFDSIEAENGEIGLKMAEEIRPDLIILDLKMPIMNGEEMLAQLRKHDWGEHIPVIILTNISRDEAPKSLAHQGIDDYIVKAMYTPTQVIQVVRRTLAKYNK